MIFVKSNKLKTTFKIKIPAMWNKCVFST
jgi:hypothetical protein